MNEADPAYRNLPNHKKYHELRGTVSYESGKKHESYTIGRLVAEDLNKIKTARSVGHDFSRLAKSSSILLNYSNPSPNAVLTLCG